MLGPCLFTIFINDISNDINSNVKIFADDTKLNNSAHLNHLMQEDLNHLLQWSNKLLLPFTIEKCKVLHYGKVNSNNDYMMNDISVSSDSSIKGSGYNNLKITSTENSRLGIIRNTFHIIDREGFFITRVM